MKFLNTELLNCPDCLALSENGKCFWLSLEQCKGQNCPFMKTEESMHSSAVHAQNRLKALDEKTQERISKKYYGGKRPWNQQ